MTPLEAEEVLNRTINNQYGLVRKIGSGSFGTIYLGTESRTKTELAIKVERKYSRKPQLPFESQVYKRLNHPFMKSMRPPGFPKLRYFGVDNDYSYLVMDLVGPTLESLFNFCSRSFKLKTVLQIMDQLVTRVEHVHSVDLIHRDIKPDNLTIGLGSTSSQIMMIDFGLSKFYRHPKTKKHKTFETDASFVGTAKFCSRYTSKGETSSRRDDMESVAYTMIYFLLGTLPWVNLKSTTRWQKLEMILDSKQTMVVEKTLKGFPKELQQFVIYCRSLKFEDQPDYMYLRNLLRGLALQWKIEFDGIYCWNKKK